MPDWCAEVTTDLPLGPEIAAVNVSGPFDPVRCDDRCGTNVIASSVVLLPRSRGTVWLVTGARWPAPVKAGSWASRKPLPWIGMGLVLLVPTVSVRGYDVLANWLGWVLVLLGTLGLPATVRSRVLLVALGASPAWSRWPCDRRRGGPRSGTPTPR